MGKRVFLKFAAWIATVGGAGYFTKMPGTVGSALACLVCAFSPVPWWAILTTALLGTGCADVYSKMKNIPDPSEVVIDEVVGMWLSLAGLPRTFILPAFLLFRIIDITKPVPVSTMEKLPGGWGIMADDVVGGIMTNLILQALYRLLS
ncbi:MAG: phosphatidylglycerophosphatase A [Synergistaceae bacterium]|nr:phosphatidylglycerophosphatase A [Synergistaceae bacterium]